MTQRIGIFSGIFDPVHKGHIGFAVEAAKQAKLDKVYFLVEAKPRRKQNVTHLAHRTAMVKLAIAPHSQLNILDLPDKQFSVSKTLPRLNQKFPNDSLFFLAGSDMLGHMPEWPLINQMLKQMDLVIGIRQGSKLNSVQKILNSMQTKAQIISSPYPTLQSGKIRDLVYKGKPSPDLPKGVSNYIKTNWLYVAPSSSNSSS